MMKNIVNLVLVAALSGCVVVPAHRTVYTETEVVYYPDHVGAYVWDAAVLSYFFVHRGHRYYMQRGWKYHNGVPQGHYRHY